MKIKILSFIVLTIIASQSAAATGIPLTDSDYSSLFSGPDSKITLDIGKEQKTATIKAAGWAAALSKENAISTSLEINAPFDKDAGQSTAGLKHGLGGATSIAFNFDLTLFSTLETSDISDEEYSALCSKYMLKTHTNDSCTAVEIEKEAEEVFAALNDKKKQDAFCAANGVRAVDCHKDGVKTSLSSQFSKQKQQIWGKYTKAWLVPIKIEYGEETFKYADPQSLKDEKSTEDSSSASIGVGYLNNKMFLGGGFEYKKAFKASKVKGICTPIQSGSSTTQCIDKNVGEPTEEETHNIFLEFRFMPASERFAVGLKIIRDEKSDQDAIQLPLYLVESKGTGLNAGLKFDWNSEDKEILPSVFFGTAFKFLN